jgi:hypothetical protein
MVALGHLWCNSGTNFVGPINASTLKNYLFARTFKTFKHLPLDSRLRLPSEAHFILAGSRPMLNYSDSQSNAPVQPAKREACVQHDQERLQVSVLNRHRQSHYKQNSPYKPSSGLHSFYPRFFSTIANIANRVQIYP